MNDEEVRAICRERLALWTEHLVSDHATPILLIGVGHDKRSGEVVLCTTEGLSDRAISVFLRGVLGRLEGR